MRLFVAIPVPAKVKHQLATATTAMGPIGGTQVQFDMLHVTLGFLGEVTPNRLPALVAALSKVSRVSAPFRVTTASVVGIPKYQPRLYALSLKPSPELKSLQVRIAQSMKDLGLPVSTKPGHITFLRLKSTPKFKLALPKVEPTSFGVESFTLFHSTLLPQGRTYKTIKTFDFSAGHGSNRLRPNVAICVLNPKNEVLLIGNREHRRSDWQLPQGGIEQQESLAEAARRELYEEVGLAHGQVIGVHNNVYSYRWPKKFLVARSGHSSEGYVGQEQSLAIVRVPEHRPRLKPDPREAARVKWVPLNRLIASLHPVRRALGKIVVVELAKLGIVDSTPAAQNPKPQLHQRAIV